MSDDVGDDKRNGGRAMNGLDQTQEDDASLWAELAAMWERVDPMPPDLVEHVLVALATDDVDAEYELLHLVSRTDELAGVRGASDALTISFSGESFALLLRVSRLGESLRRVDGWVTPARPMTVTVRQRGRSWDAAVDAQGRFELSDVPGGLSRFWLVGATAPGTADGHDSPALFTTPTFEL